MSNYFPNARPLQSTLATMTALDPISYTCIGVFIITTTAPNLKDELLTQYINEPTDFPAYETIRDFEETLNKVEGTFLLGGRYGFPALTVFQIAIPTTGIMIYNNINFQGLSIEGSSTACSVALYIRQ